MKAARRKKLEAAGFKVGSAAEFLGLTPEEEMIVNIKIALASQVREMRSRKKWSQKTLADHMKSSQSRIAKIESADSSVSVELMMRSLGAMGASMTDVGIALGGKVKTVKRSTKKQKVPA